ncbi:hypothetical protein LSH36_934g02041 [Paralvinella palmiformis]|uniref:SH3 domain-containing protein n=1 Tax=Paralvinella palmiformis TaxID=53620 RepID=A0AAD9IYV8_9ANNE|nr:hypothetical protein LSH36_934g02041 [Paralvinella palmiformis]
MGTFSLILAASYLLVLCIAPQSPPPVTRRRPKLTMRMKSCSVDTPGDRPTPSYLHDNTMKGSESFSSAPGGFVEYLWRGSQSRMSSHGSSGSEYDRKLASSPKSGPPHHSPVTSRSRRRKLNMRMKSFSVDTPEPPKTTFDESSKKKSSSFTNAASCFGAPASPLPAVSRRAKFLLGSGSVDIEDGYDSLSPRSNQSLSPRSGSPMTVKCKPQNIYVVLYNYRLRVRGDVDLKAGTRVTVTDMSDPDWWKGRSNGRYGYFPSSYVMKINIGEKPLQVVTGVEVTKGQKETKLLKDQIVICETELPEEEDMVIIRTSDKTRLPCPLRYLAEVAPS